MRFEHLHIPWEAAQHVWDKHRLEPIDVREALEDAGRRKAVYRGPNSRDGGRTYIARGGERRLVMRCGCWSNTAARGLSP
ncbi:MAG: hypothetical protein ACRDQZ_10425 [Mycobacteriales bacterium]